jgi:hypothetical protein
MGIISSKRCYDPEDPEYYWNEPYGSVSWTVSCKSDPRFNGNGAASSILSASSAIDEHVKRKILEFGLQESEVPTDIEYSGGKS